MTMKDKIKGKFENARNYVTSHKHYPTAKKYAPHTGIAAIALGVGLIMGQCGEPTCEEPNNEPDVTLVTPAPTATKKPIITTAVPNPVRQNTLCDVVVDGYVAKKKDRKTCLNVPIRDVGNIPIRNHDSHKNKLTCDIMDIFFATNSWQLYTNDLNDVANYAQSVEPGKTMTLESHADIRGTEAWNDKLATERANSVEEVLVRNGKGLKIQKAIYGERKATQTAKKDMYKDRRVSITPAKNVVSRGLDVLASDLYLIDQSSSMGESLPSGQSKWQAVQNHKFAKGKKVYTFTSENRQCGTKLANEHPHGDTPLYDSLYQLIQKTEKGKSITVLTDGADTGSKTSPQEIIAYAKKNNIEISHLNLSGGHNTNMQNIAQQTGGNIYRVTK